MKKQQTKIMRNVVVKTNIFALELIDNAKFKRVVNICFLNKKCIEFA